MLEELISRLPRKEIRGNPALEVRGVAYHSGAVEEGFLFAVIRGLREDGQRYIPEALSRGARAFLVDRPLETPGAVQVVVPDVREALARVASAFYGDPSASLTLVGITGTNGKTTTSYLIESILQRDGRSVGVMGTVNYRFQGKIFPAPTTTPESLDLQRNLKDMREAGVSHAVVEVSSHSLDLQRVRGCDFDVAVFTNLTRDHLDYHGSMEDYFRAKQRLFTQGLGESGKERRFAVLNMDDPRGAELAPLARGRVLRTVIESRAEVWPRELEEGPEGLKFRIATPRGSFRGTSSLIGRHNLYNILAAVSAGEALGVPLETMAEGVAALGYVPGRLQPVGGGGGIRVFVDYAHTPDALERALETVNKIRGGRLVVVFGCGGDRDRGKRAEMGKVAALGSDLAVLTSDNPRTEDPLGILAEIEKGARSTGRRRYEPSLLSPAWTDPGYVMVPDRKEAIRKAVDLSRDGDVVLIAGKGHEDYQILGREKIHFDDREEALEALTRAGRKADR